jgi:peptide/nickel transport system substrate-binding protein
MFQFKLNMEKPPTDDLAFRKAMALAFDYETLFGLLDVAGIKAGTPSRGPIPSNALGYDPSVPVMKRDLAGAQQALAQSKYKPNQHTVELVWTKEVPQEEKFALLFQQSMAEIGVKVNVVSMPWAQFQQSSATNQATPNVSSIFVGLVTPDADSLLWPEYHSSAFGTYNSMGWVTNPEVDHLLEQARAQSDLQTRAEIYRTLGRTVAAQYPAVFTFDSATVVALQNYVSAPTLQDPAMAVPILAGNYQFRLMEITK